MFIEAVQARWFSLLDERDFVGNQSGRVIVQFRLHNDGRISNVSIVNSTVGDLLSWFCQRAVSDPAPYQPFPPDLRRLLNTEYREIRFTFYYNQ
jgi:outer membrane biosynthesis protein TonB